jgi:hypothetical protein
MVTVVLVPICYLSSDHVISAPVIAFCRLMRKIMKLPTSSERLNILGHFTNACEDTTSTTTIPHYQIIAETLSACPARVLSSSWRLHVYKPSRHQVISGWLDASFEDWHHCHDKGTFADHVEFYHMVSRRPCAVKWSSWCISFGAVPKIPIFWVPELGAEQQRIIGLELLRPMRFRFEQS